MTEVRVLTNLIIGEGQFRHPNHFCLEGELLAMQTSVYVFGFLVHNWWYRGWELEKSIWSSFVYQPIQISEF